MLRSASTSGRPAATATCPKHSSGHGCLAFVRNLRAVAEGRRAVEAVKAAEEAAEAEPAASDPVTKSGGGLFVTLRPDPEAAT